MTKKILPLILIFCSLMAVAQKDLKEGCVVLENNDTICGMLKNKKYYSAGGVKLFREDKKIIYPKRAIAEIYIHADRYVKSDMGLWKHAFFKKEVSGNVNVYTFKRKKRLGGFDSDINFGRLIPAIKFYCDDYPGLEDTLQYINKKNVDEFVVKYNAWKANNPGSKSYFENNIHSKPLINFKLSFLLPGAGIEFGLSEKVSLSTMLKNEFGYGSSVGWIVNPFLDTQLRYYHNIDKRKAENKRTYKYSGNYVCLVNAYFFDTGASLTGIEYGWQRVINKHWYFNLGLGAAKWTTGDQGFTVLYDIDFGYNF